MDRPDWIDRTCVEYALPDQYPEGAGSWSRMAHHLGRAWLTEASPPRGPGKTPLGDEALPVGCHTETIVWTVLGHRLRRLYSAPQEIPYTSSFWASFKRDTLYRFFSHIRRTHITVMWRWDSLGSLISRRHSQTHSQHRCVGHTFHSMHGDRSIYSVPRFQPGIDPFIEHPSRTEKMPVYRAPCICSLIRRDTTTSYMARRPSAKPPHLSFFGIAKRRTSSKYQSKGRFCGETRSFYNRMMWKLITIINRFVFWNRSHVRLFKVTLNALCVLLLECRNWGHCFRNSLDN